MPHRTFFLAVAALAAASPALADWRPDAWFVEGGIAARDTWAATAGVKWTGGWKKRFIGTEVTGSLDLQVSHWQWDHFNGGRSGSNSLGLMPLARLRFAEGRSPWFFEGGIGMIVADRKYFTPDKQFSTRWNFNDVIAFGYTMRNGNELSARITHNSNAGVTRPNPGENFLQIRWGSKF